MVDVMEGASKAVESEIEAFMTALKARDPHQPEFHQAARELIDSVMPFYLDHQRYREANLLERITEPDRSIIFRVTWMDDAGKIRVNRGMRIQFCNAIGPYKGGLRFHPTVNLSVLKFLGFEQIFKNALTGLAMGGGKGGSDFDPKGKSDNEVMRFCQAFMTELHRHIGADTDVPAGDIGVGAREIGYLYGQYVKLANQMTGVLTGKGLTYGGSLIRPEATGYGATYFMQNMLNHVGDGIEGKTVVVSGSGNVALYAIERNLAFGAKVVTASDSGGFIHDPDGFNQEKLAFLKDLKEVRRGRISEYAETFGCSYHAGERPWGVPCDLAYPCATQNEIDADDARTLVANGCIGVSEGANMPCNLAAIRVFEEARTKLGPAKAANAGGVGVSGLEMAQNSARVRWSREEVDNRLQGIMSGIHKQCVHYGQADGWVDYVKGANIAGFAKVADTLLAYGVH